MSSREARAGVASASSTHTSRRADGHRRDIAGVKTRGARGDWGGGVQGLIGCAGVVGTESCSSWGVQEMKEANRCWSWPSEVRMMIPDSRVRGLGWVGGHETTGSPARLHARERVGRPRPAGQLTRISVRARGGPAPAPHRRPALSSIPPRPVFLPKN